MNYGFSDQALPTYAEANLGGKTRFLPINLVESAGNSMHFGDDKGWQISGFYLQLDNDHHSLQLDNDHHSLQLGKDHHSDILIYPDDADAKASYASYLCDVVGTKRIKG